MPVFNSVSEYVRVRVLSGNEKGETECQGVKEW